MTTYLIVFLPCAISPAILSTHVFSLILSKQETGAGRENYGRIIVSHCPAGSAVRPLAHRVLHYSDVQWDVCLVHIC